MQLCNSYRWPANLEIAHTKEVYELEMFYGDDTLKHLMDHTRSFNEYLDTFEYIYSLTDEQLIEAETEIKEIEIGSETQAQAPN